MSALSLKNPQKKEKKLPPEEGCCCGKKKGKSVKKTPCFEMDEADLCQSIVD